MKSLTFIGLIVLLSCCTQQGKELIKQREGLLKSSWKEAGLDSVQLTTLMESNYFRLSSRDIKKYFYSEVLLTPYLLDTLSNGVEDNKRLAIIDYLIAYANAKQIEKKLISNEIVANSLRVSIVPLSNTCNDAHKDSFLIKVGLDYPEKSGTNPYLILDHEIGQKADTLFFDGYNDDFLIIPERNQRTLSGQVFIYNHLYKKRLAYPFSMPL